MKPIAECWFWQESRYLSWDGTLGKILPVAPQKVTKFLEYNQYHVWTKKPVAILDHIIVGPFDFSVRWDLSGHRKKSIRIYHHIDDFSEGGCK